MRNLSGFSIPYDNGSKIFTSLTPYFSNPLNEVTSLIRSGLGPNPGFRRSRLLVD